MKTYSCHNSKLLALLFDNFGPYHLAQLEALTELGKIQGFDVVGIEIAAQELIHPWVTRSAKWIGKKQTLFPEQAVEEVPTWRLVRSMWKTLNQANPRALALSNYNCPGMLTALAWAKLRRRTAVLLIDSKYDDFPRQVFKEWLKRRIISLFDAALVGGTLSRQYVQLLGMAPERISIGCDVIDNNYFSRHADRARETASSLRKKYQLPENYFLSVGRLAENKNFSRLLEAYSQYCRYCGDQAWSLVVCGSGPLENEIKLKARQLGVQEVLFPGFTQINDLPIYYGLARCFIMPSLGDTWGLVVNEAMASGLPLLVSRACGCVPDLVHEGADGFTFDPYDVEGMARLLLRMSSNDVDLKAMGKVSRGIIANWSLDSFANGLLEAINVAHGHPF